jgi:hypothetical protein
MTPFVRNATDLKRIITTINDFSPLAGLSINMDKSEVLELGESAEGVGLKISTEVTITGITFSRDIEEMSTKNWEKVRDKAQRLYNAWSGRQLTIIGKAAIIRAQIQPLVIFTGSSSVMPLHIEKQLVEAQSKFIFHGPDKEKRSLMHKKLEEGGLSIPHWRSRLASVQAKWISRLQEGSGEFRQVFFFDDIDWDDPRSFISQFPKQQGSSYADACLNSWLDNLKLLEPNLDGLVWPLLRGDLQTRTKHQCGKTSVRDALQNSMVGLNFLDQIRINRQLRTYIQEEDEMRKKGAQELRRARFRGVNPLPRTAQTESQWRIKISELDLKYSGKLLKDMDQRSMYWLSGTPMWYAQSSFFQFLVH